MTSGRDTYNGAAVEINNVYRTFGSTRALDGVSMSLDYGQIHAFLGPNGAGKTTLLRILAGLLHPDGGRVRVLDLETEDLKKRVARKKLGLIPSGDRTFYLRLSGLENLIFFGRLYGLRLRKAAQRAGECLEAVGLSEAARKPVGHYSHGMQKRLSVARALLLDPPFLLVDEATHDLDLEGARRIQNLIRGAADRGASVVWATQRMDEIRGFADHVTLLNQGKVRFTGTVPQLMAISASRRYLLHLRNGRGASNELIATARAAVGDRAEVQASGDADGEHFRLLLHDDVILGDALGSLMSSGISILGCREERSEIEEAFLLLTSGDQP